ncbi:patatin-like phospholipase family protein [Patescibacteria group bacterium]|nr:patatin-like phospholipase family protein [Patescibacteria group bacterium]
MTEIDSKSKSGDPSSWRLSPSSRIIANLIKKRAYLVNNDARHVHYKTALIINGGIMWGAYAAGALAGLEKLGMTNVFDHIIGVSSGAAAGAYFLSKQTELGGSIYYEDLTGKRFINFLRVSKVMDLDYLEEIMRNEKKLNIENIKQHRTNFLVSVTNVRTGKTKLLSANQADDIISLLKASMTVPGMANSAVKVNGEEYVDGGVSSRIPMYLEYALNVLGCTDILVIANIPRNLIASSGASLYKRLASNIFAQRLSPQLKKSYIAVVDQLHKDWDFMHDDRFAGQANVSVMYFDNLKTSRFTTDSTKLQNLITEGRNNLLRSFTPKDE